MRSMLMAAVAAVAVATVARADEEKIALDKLPKAVLDAAKKRFPKAEWTDAAKETDGDKVTYEVSGKDGDTKMDLTFTPDGKLTLIEKVIDAKALPKAVAATLAEKYPKATFKIIEEVIKVDGAKEALDYYELLLTTADKKEIEVQLLPDGKVKAAEEKKDEPKKVEPKKDK